ncbi:Large polyvalent protein associated domain-containing protein [Candidatus Magnetomoraceae bacterium gMMP-15]
MIVNHVQERLINELIDYAKIKYPEVSLKTITESPSDSERIWAIVNGIDWNDDDKTMDFLDYLSLKEDDILVEYGYPISLMPISLP